MSIHDRIRWERRVGRVFARTEEAFSARRLDGVTIAVWKVLGPNTAPPLLGLARSGARILAGSSHEEVASPGTIEWLRGQGIELLAHAGMTPADYADYLGLAAAARPDFVLDSGGALISACLDRSIAPRAAMEGTRTGILRLAGRDIGFPVLDWNDTPLKNAIEHRFHVADGFWSAFAYVTGLSLFGRRVAVLGFGPVGKGVAERARDLGARVTVVEVSDIRAIEAAFHGHAVASAAQAVASADIVVSATGRDWTVTPDLYAVAGPETIFCNAGHSEAELSVRWLREQGLEPLTDRISRARLAGGDILLLCDGATLNLSSGAGPFGTDVWDLFNALILRGAHWLADGAEALAPGLQPFPIALQEAVARDWFHVRGAVRGDA